MAEEANAVNDPVDPGTTPADPAPAENKTPEMADPVIDELSKDDEPTEGEPQSSPEPDEKQEEEPEETPEEQPQGKAETRKQQLNTEIRDLVAQKNALRQQVETLNSQVYKPQSAQELVDEGYSEEVAEVKALKQELELQNYNNKVVEANIALGESSAQVLKDFPIFNPDSDEFQPEIAAQAAEALEASLIRDPNTGQIVGSSLSPYQIYKPIADAYSMSHTQGQIKGQKATEKMLSNVDSRGSLTPAQPKKDPLLEILSSDD